jgi:hypothetical protein
LAELKEQVRRVRQEIRPIPVPWDDGDQCLQAAVAACLRLPPHRVPERRDHEEIDEWDARVAQRLGVRLELLDRDETPTRGEAWIAIVPGSSGEFTHAIAALGNDPAARGRLAGFRIVPA